MPAYKKPACTRAVTSDKPFHGVPLCISSQLLSLSFRISSWSQPPTPANLIRFQLLVLWDVSALSYRLSLLSLTHPYALASSSIFQNCACYTSPQNKSLYQNDQKQRKNYRPVFNLSFVSEIIEKLVLSQLSDHLSANNLYNCFQSVYQPGHDTKIPVPEIVNDLLPALGGRNVSLLALLDLSAASDTSLWFRITRHGPRLVFILPDKPHSICQHPLLHLRTSSHIFRCSTWTSLWTCPLRFLYSSPFYWY